jgi:hypothetical protein
LLFGRADGDGVGPANCDGDQNIFLDNQAPAKLNVIRVRSRVAWVSDGASRAGDWAGYGPWGNYRARRARGERNSHAQERLSRFRSFARDPRPARERPRRPRSPFARYPFARGLERGARARPRAGKKSGENALKRPSPREGDKPPGSRAPRVQAAPRPRVDTRERIPPIPGTLKRPSAERNKPGGPKRGATRPIDWAKPSATRTSRPRGPSKARQGAVSNKYDSILNI